MSEASQFRGEIYVHTNRVNGKSYVGQTTCGMMRRWGKHLTAAKIPKHPGYPALIAKAIRKHGAAAFEHQVLSVANSKEELDNLEKIWIILLQTQAPNGYNITSGGGGWTPERKAEASARPRHFSPEGRAALVKNGLAHRGFKQPKDAVEKTAAANRGRKRTPEACANIAASQIGNTKSSETRAKISAAKLGVKDSPETCAKKSASKCTPEARAANSARVKAYWAIPENKEKLRDAMKKWGASPEVKSKLSSSAKSRRVREKAARHGA